MKITYLGWASFLIETMDGTTLVTDPYFGGEGMVPPIEEAHRLVSRWDKLDAIAVSHNSVDHLGEAYELARRFGSLLVCGIDVKIRALQYGIPKEQIGLVVPAAELSHGGVHVKAVEAHHVSFRELAEGQYLTGYPLGFIITDLADGLTVYFPGDTSVFGDMALLARLYKPTLAMLGIGGVFQEGRPVVEMSPREAAVAASLLDLKYAIPMHYFPETGAAQELAAELAVEAPNCTLLALQPGDAIDFAKNWIRRVS